jgi:hypothetical protein
MKGGWRMKEVKSPTIFQLALEQAAEEAYDIETVEAEGETKEQWMEDKINLWIAKVEKKFRLAKRPGVVQKNLDYARKYYSMSIGDRQNLNKDVCIHRVPGGWMWQSIDRPSPAVFIPFSDDFVYLINGDHQ